MKKRTRSIIRAVIAGALALVVALTTITENEQMLFARETFSGLQTLLANNQQLTIVEVVDDFEESSFGYLIGGTEPYDVEDARQNGEMDALLDDLTSRGLLTTGNTDDWNSYPLRYEITDTVYSDYPNDPVWLDAKYRLQGEAATALRGYYELIPESEIDPDPDNVDRVEKAFYRVSGSYSSYSDDAMRKMSPARLRKLAEDLFDSYAPDGYDTTDSSYVYFRFVVGDPENAAAAQVQTASIFNAEVFSANGIAAGPVVGGETTVTVTVTPSPTPTVEGTNEPVLEGTPSEDDSTFIMQMNSNSVVPADGNTVQSGSNVQSSGTLTNPSGSDTGTGTLTTNPSSSDAGTGASNTPDSTNVDDTTSEDAQQLDPAEAERIMSSASPVIYVELDENNSVLVASLGFAGVGDILALGNVDLVVEESSPAPVPTPVETTTPTDEKETSEQEQQPNTPTEEEKITSTPAGEGEEEITSTPAGEGEEEITSTPTDEEDPYEGEGGDGQQEEGPFTITYSWTRDKEVEGTLKENADGTDQYNLPDLRDWKVTIESETEGETTYYTVNSDYPEGKTLWLFNGGQLLGTYTFSGWHLKGSNEILNGTEIEVTGNVELKGEWTWNSAGIRVTYEWMLIDAEDDTLLSMDGITLGISESESILRPEDHFASSRESIRESITADERYKIGYRCNVYDKEGNLIGSAEFMGWGEGVETIAEIDEDALESTVMIPGYWLFSARAASNVNITYQWRLQGSEDEYQFPQASSTPTDGKYSFGNTTLPNGVVLENGGYFLVKPPTSLQGVSDSWNDSTDDTDGTDITQCLSDIWSGGSIDVYEDGELIGTYKFVGWTGVCDGDSPPLQLPCDAEKFMDWAQNKTNITIIGEWTYENAFVSGVPIGTGMIYTYIRDGIHNNDWFRYYVMGLEEKDFAKVNIQLVTYLADGSDKRMSGYGPCGADCSLDEAITKADLVYLNTDGVDANGNAVARRFTTENAKTLLARACNADRRARLAVILDSSVRSNSVDDNIKKVRTILLQSDIVDAYQSLEEGGIVYESAFSAEGWQILAAKADEAVKNNGNFVRDNIYCVSDRRSEFRNTTYSEDMSYINKDMLPSLANADFENRFTDAATDAGFAEVYQAIQKENYERARNGGQASLDEYVMPATAVAYILNFRDYDPIIYKDKIRVLELEPCRDYTYYYDEKDHPTPEGELERKKQFATDWAPDFLEKLEADPDAITIDGMTTSEFCGKILDIYEEYDVIYIGSNDGILHQQTYGGGLTWMRVSSYNGTVSRRKQNDEKTLYTYHDGNWYESKAVSEEQKEVLLPDGPAVSVGDWKWKWDPSNGTWIKLKDEGTEVTPDWDIQSGYYRYDHSTGEWYEKRYDFSEETLLPNGIDEEFFLDGSNANDSTWRWRTAGGEWINNEYVTHETGWYHKVYAEPVTYTKYEDSNMDGMLYTHVGDKMKDTYGNYDGHLVNESAYGFRSSGNDILSTQVDELIDYLNGGSLVILSSDFMTENENGKYVINSSDMVYPTARGTGHGILDTSSYVYQFVRECFERKADGSDVPRYANLIVEDYGNGNLRDTEAVIEALNQQKVTLNLYAKPTPYGYDECAVTKAEGTVINPYNNQAEHYERNYSSAVTRIDEDTRSMLQKEADGKYYLNYEFIIGNLSAVAPLTTRYHVQLFLDSNSDGIYNMASEELGDITVINAQTGAVLEREGGRYQLQMNVPYRVRRELPDGYVGCIGWKLMVTQNGNEHIHDSVTGLTAVAVQPGYSDEVNPVTGKKIIHVLQITPYLYGNKMDLETQTDLLNSYNGNGNFDEEWYELLTNLPDFEIDFDSIYYWDFAHSFLRPGEPNYESQYDNGGVDGKLTGPSGRRDYLNFYQYDMVIVGFCDCVPSIPSQRAVEALLRYADMGKSMLFTHDTTYSGGFTTADPSNFTYASGLGQPLSMSIRDLCGMDRHGVSVDWYRYDGETAQNNREGSPIRTPSAQASAYNASSAAYQWYASHPGGNSRDVAYAPGTNQTMMAAQTQGLTWSLTGNVYEYMFNWASHGKITSAGKNRDTVDAADTNTVTQVNGGIITQYPYDIPLQIEVGDTHAQYYQLDLDTDWDGDGRGDVVCWYAISSLDDGDWNDIYDFSPNDVRNNYYIYNKGNITYTGVGHSTDHITLDEKKLFINTFVAAYSAGIRNPSVRIVENGSVNAPDLESVSIPFNGVDEATAGTYRVYYQVKDNNITQGTRNLSIKYYIGDAAGSDTITYRTEDGTVMIPANLFADDALTTYSADTGLPVAYNEVHSGYSYYVDVPLNKLLYNEKFEFYVEVDLTMADDPGRVAAFDVDRLTIAKLKMFSLD